MASSETAPLLRQESTTSYAPDEEYDETTAARSTFARNLGALDGFALLISIVIGSGVFSSPGPIDANVPSPGAGLLVWLVGGILAWSGALTMAELGTAFPGEGGIQPYLTYIYGDTAVTHFLGKGVAYFATALICLVIAGSALGNSFVAGRMTVAAANNNWFPRVFGTVGHVGTLRVSKIADSDEPADMAMDNGESPINALILNTILSGIYILLGNMRILLTLNGLAEYAFFFLTVLGAIILRFREPDLPRPVKPLILIPILFALISGFVVVRGAVFAPIQAAILVGIWLCGLVFYFVRLWFLKKRSGRSD
ncbi:unnamed protein product [Alternaria alternata]